MDYSSFGAVDANASEMVARANYQALVRQITNFERSLAVHSRLEEDGLDLSMGENTSIFDEVIDNGVILARAMAEAQDALLFKVRFSKLLNILIMNTCCVNNHDRFVSSGYIDPFCFRPLGYSLADFKDGRIVDKNVPTDGEAAYARNFFDKVDTDEASMISVLTHQADDVNAMNAMFHCPQAVDREEGSSYNESVPSALPDLELYCEDNEKEFDHVEAQDPASARMREFLRDDLSQIAGAIGAESSTPGSTSMQPQTIQQTSENNQVAAEDEEQRQPAKDQHTNPNLVFDLVEHKSEFIKQD